MLKTLLSIILSLMTQNALAEGSNPPRLLKNRQHDPSLEFSRLSYFAHKNVFNFMGRLFFPVAGLSETYTNQTLTSSSTSNFNSFDASLVYGINDWMRIGFSQNILLTSGVHTSTPGAAAAADTYSYGFADPAFNVTFRFLDPKSYGLSSDLLLAGSPSFSNHSVTNQSQVGDNTRGYATTTATLSFYYTQKMNDLLFAAAATNDFNGAANSDTLNTSFTREADGLSYSFTFADRIHFGAFYLHGEAVANLAHSYKQTFGGTSSTLKLFSIPNRLNPKVIFGFCMNERAQIEAEFVKTDSSTDISSNTGPPVHTTSTQSTLSIRLKTAF